MKLNTLLAASLLSLSISAQTIQKIPSGIQTKANGQDVVVQFYGPSTVRILKSPTGKPFKKESLSVIKTPENVTVAQSLKGDELQLKTNGMRVDLNLKNGKVSFYDAKGQVLLNETESGSTFTDFNDVGNPTFTVKQNFKLQADEDIYGMGQQQHGKLSLRNIRLNMVQGNTDDYVPFFVSTMGYGLFWDNYSPTTFEDKPEMTSFK